jgi:hypothetical protein
VRISRRTLCSAANDDTEDDVGEGEAEAVALAVALCGCAGGEADAMGDEVRLEDEDDIDELVNGVLRSSEEPIFEATLGCVDDDEMLVVVAAAALAAVAFACGVEAAEGGC